MAKINWKRIMGGLVAGALSGVAGSLALAATDWIERRYIAGSDSQSAKTAQSALGLNSHPDDEWTLRDNAINFGYGAAAGAIRGGVEALGLTGLFGTLLYWGTVSLASKTVLPAIGLKPRLQKPRDRSFLVNIAHQGIYAVVSIVILGAFKKLGHKKA